MIKNKTSLPPTNYFYNVYKEKKKHSDIESSYKFEPGQIMNFQEMKLDVVIKMLKDSGICVS